MVAKPSKEGSLKGRAFPLHTLLKLFMFIITALFFFALLCFTFTSMFYDIIYVYS